MLCPRCCTAFDDDDNDDDDDDKDNDDDDEKGEFLDDRERKEIRIAKEKIERAIKLVKR